MTMRPSAASLVGLVMAAFSVGLGAHAAGAGQGGDDGVLLGKRPPRPTPTTSVSAPVVSPPQVGGVEARLTPVAPASDAAPRVLPAPEPAVPPAPLPSPVAVPPRVKVSDATDSLPRTGTGTEGLLGLGGLALVAGAFALEAARSRRPLEV